MTSLAARRHEILAVSANEPGNDIAGEGSSGSQSRHELVGAQRIPALCERAGLHLPDNLISTLLYSPVKVGAGIKLPEAVLPITVPWRGIRSAPGRQDMAFRGTVSRTCVRCPAEQRQCLTHRVERLGTVAAEPVVPCHGVRMQLTQPLLALTRGRRCRRVSIRKSCGRAPCPSFLEQIGLGEPPIRATSFLAVISGVSPWPGRG